MRVSELQPAQRIGSLRPYSPPPRDPSITLQLDNNEGAPIDASIFEVIRAIDPEALTRYPDASGLENQLSKQYGVDQSRVIVTNGGDDAIDRVCRALLGPGGVMLTHAPGFVMIPRYAKLAGAEVELVDWLRTDFPLDTMLNKITAGTRLVALISPCNPTGSVIETESILTIVTKARSVGAVVLLDQAYIEFAEQDPIESMLGLSNIVIVRTLSKAMGLAGLRVGYAIGPAEIIEWLRVVGGPYPVSAFSLAIAHAACVSGADRAPVIRDTIARREELAESMESMGIEVVPSQGNFVLARFEDASHVYRSLLKQGVSVRRFVNGGEIESYLRITVPTDPNQQRALLNAIKQVREDLRKYQGGML